MTRSTIWKLTCWLAALLLAATFTPLVIPVGQSQPSLFSLPYTLWTGILISVLFVVLVFIGAYYHPSRKP
ncbi:hypothetical protein [Telluribacter sp. SYSU D00476]|uniref:hypothetical protein n=1 Tax=Telluribacter sp. SYSU D00476 TaxID=2811430 RepID=UPI001FF6EF70|nr:hypothetical protein [Telluribacter sp. SYSU D00476]